MIQSENFSILWINFHQAFVSYVVPLVLVASTLQNLFTIATLIGMNKGIARTTRAILMTLAIADLFNMLVWYGVSLFANYGLYYLTRGTFYSRDIFSNEIACKLVPALGYFGLYCSHWLYVLVNADRAIAVLKPHRSQRSRIRQRLQAPIGIIVFFGLLTAGLVALLNQVNPSATASGMRTLNF